MTSTIALALDVHDSSSVPLLVEAMPTDLNWYKVGLELYISEGPIVLDYLREQQKKIFLDLKLHDIPRTVERAVLSAAHHGIDLLTVHAAGGREMLKAASQAAAEADRPVKLVAVTMLTSLDEHNLQSMGVNLPPADYVKRLAELALSSGIDGLVCSVWEAASLRREFGCEPILVTPGIRLPDESSGDQKRVATPSRAVREGSSMLVVGRTIVQAQDPSQAARDVLAAMQQASPPGVPSESC